MNPIIVRTRPPGSLNRRHRRMRSILRRVTVAALIILAIAAVIGGLAM
jgi:hypothetical protein